MLIPCLVIIIVVQITDLPSRYDGDKGVQVCVCVSVCIHACNTRRIDWVLLEVSSMGDYGICTSFFRNPNPLEYTSHLKPLSRKVDDHASSCEFNNDTN